MIPHAKHFDPYNPCPEPGVLELGQCYQLCQFEAAVWKFQDFLSMREINFGESKVQ